MKKMKIVSSVFLLGLIVLASCKDKGETPPSEEQVQLGLLAKTWNVTTGANSVTLDGQDEEGNWNLFKVTFTENYTYTAQAVSPGREVVWPASGTWDFYIDPVTNVKDLNRIERDDKVVISIAVDEATLKMTFTYTEPGGRVDGTEGLWVFNMAL